jgi:hypothetical protein
MQTNLAECSASAFPAYLRQRSMEMLTPDSPALAMPYQRRSKERRSKETSEDSTAPVKPFRWRSIEMHRNSASPVKPYRQQSTLDLFDESTAPVMPCPRGSTETSEDSNAPPFRWRSIEMHRGSTSPIKPYRQQSTLDLSDESTAPAMPYLRGPPTEASEDSTESTLPCSRTTAEVQELSDTRNDLSFV